MSKYDSLAFIEGVSNPLGKFLSENTDDLIDSEETKRFVEDLAFVKRHSDYNDKGEYTGPLGNLVTMGDAFEPIVPIYTEFKRGVLSQKNEDGSEIPEEDRLKRLNKFFSIFGLSSHKVPMNVIEPVDAQSISAEAEAYYNLVDANNKARFFDLIETEVNVGDKTITSYKRYYSDAEVKLDILELTDDGLVVAMECRLPYGEQYIYKDSAVTAKALTTWLNPLETALAAYQAFMGIVGEKVAKWKVTYRALDTYSESKLKTDILVKSRGYSLGACIHPKIMVVGTPEDFEVLGDVCDKLNIALYSTKVVSVDAVSKQQDAVVMNQLMSSGRVETAKDYGCMMYLSWLAFSDFYMSSWRGVAGMRDWLRFAGKEDATEALRKIDTYAVVEIETGTILITSAGFLNLTEGTVEEPVSVEWLDMDTVMMLCGIISDESFTIGSYTQALSDGKISDFVRYDQGYVRVVKGLSYLYNKLYKTDGSFANYEEGWMNVFLSHWRGLNINPNQLRWPYNDDWRNRDNSIIYQKFKRKYAEYVGAETNLEEILKNRVSASILAGATYGAGTENSPREKDGFDGREVVTMRKIIHIMHSLIYEDDRAKVRICVTPLGRKTVAPTLVSLDEAKNDPNYVLLPKHKIPVLEGFKQEIKDAWEKALAQEEKRKKADNKRR